MQNGKTIFDYSNYREFLRDFYASAKVENKNFSLRVFSRMAGFKSQSVLKLVMEGKRNIAPYSIEKFVKALKLNQKEAFFFKNLVLLNQAKTVEERQKYAQELLTSKSFREAHPMKEAEYNYFSNWYFVLIRELVDLPGFTEDYNWIAKQIHPAITPGQAKKAVEELLLLGLLQRDAQGMLRQTNNHLTTPDEVVSSALVKYHREMLQRASESIERIEREKRDISAQTFGISSETAKKIKEMIQDFRKQIIEVVAQDQAADSVYQLNFQLFPLAQVPPKSEEPS